MATSAEPHTTACGLVPAADFRRVLVLSWEQPSCLDSTSLGCGYGSSGQATTFIKACDKGLDTLARRRRTFEQRGRCPFTRCEGGVIAARTLPFQSL